MSPSLDTALYRNAASYKSTARSCNKHHGGDPRPNTLKAPPNLHPLRYFKIITTQVFVHRWAIK
jgi:hypothetical protein